jgi:HlyD family secretion protein
MKPKRLKLVWLSIILVLGAIAALVFLSGRKPVPGVAVQAVARGNLSAAVITNGKIEPISPYEMRALVPGHVTAVSSTEGQLVKKGQLLLELDNSQLKADVARAREDLVTNRENLRIAQAGGPATQLAQLDSDIRRDAVEHTRLQSNVAALEKLVASQAATQQELTDARANLARLEADQRRLETSRTDFARQTKLDVDRLTLLVQQSQGNLTDLEQKLASTYVSAPADGTLYSLPVTLNSPVKAGDLLAAVADLRRIRVRAFVDEPELGQLAPGQTVIVTWDALPNRTWTGRTTQVPRQVVPHGTRTVGELLCPLNNDDQHLIPNTNVNVRIELQSRNNVIVVPRGAISFDGTRRYVFLVQKDSPYSVLHKREVQLGISDSTTFEVLSGLNVGDEIALPNNFEPADGMKVRVVQPE